MIYKTVIALITFSSFNQISDLNKAAYQQSIPGTTQKIDMVYVPGGNFVMGSPKSEKNHFGDEGPQHEVEIAPFWMGKYEITWDLYELFVSREIDSKKTRKSRRKRGNN